MLSISHIYTRRQGTISRLHSARVKIKPCLDMETWFLKEEREDRTFKVRKENSSTSFRSRANSQSRSRHASAVDRAVETLKGRERLIDCLIVYYCPKVLGYTSDVI